MQSNRLKLNADKTECVWVTTRQRQSTFAAPNLTVGGSIIVPSKGARNFGVFFDSKLDLKSHLSEMLVLVAVNPALRRNRSADRGDLTVPRAKNTSYSDRSFAIAAPMLWNSFPVELRCSSSMTIFCKSLETYVFRAAYNIVSPPTY